MSYNVDSVEIVRGSLRIRPEDVRKLRDKHKSQLPEDCFLTELRIAKTAKCENCAALNDVDAAFCKKCGLKMPAPTEEGVEIKRLAWNGEGSGWSFDTLKDKIAPFLMGEADVVFTWEGGDSVSGLRFKDGKVIECDVGYVLTPKKK